MMNHPINSIESYYEPLAQTHRYTINDAIQAILRLQTAYLLDVQPENLRRELDLEMDEFDFSYAIKKLLAFLKDLKKIDAYKMANLKKPNESVPENVE